MIHCQANIITVYTSANTSMRIATVISGIRVPVKYSALPLKSQTTSVRLLVNDTVTTVEGASMRKAL